MLAGEYAVLKGGRCLAATVDQWLSVTVGPRSDRGQGVKVHSSIWPRPIELAQLTASQCAAEPLLQTLEAYHNEAALGDLSIQVDSAIDVKSGFGSSTAVRLAALLALDAWRRGRAEASPQGAAPTLLARAREVWQLQQKQQNFASGYDVLTQVSGGLMAWQPNYENWPGEVQRLPSSGLRRSVQVWIGGAGAPTAALGSKVQSWLAEGRREAELFERSEELVAALRLFLEEEGQHAALERLMRANQAHRRILAAAPHYPLELLAKLEKLDGFDVTWTFKTTGAGGEDAVLLIGSPAALGTAAQAMGAAGWRRLEQPFTESRASWEIRQNLQ